ncbi:MAG: hypothetical protein R3C15_22355 [Thermoleophilia bacterium]
MIYAFPADGADRFGQLVSGIATDLAAVDAWWRGQDPGRTPRFDLADFPGCTTTFGRLDVSRVQLPKPATRYRPAKTSLARLIADLSAAGFTSPDKKYLVYYDGPVANVSRCGEGNRGLVGGGPNAVAAVYLGACGATVGTGERSAAITAAHELLHGLNALVFPHPDPGPPNACADDEAHPCDDPKDLLYPRRSSLDTLDQMLLDAGHDDYYGHQGAWWDARDSLFLLRLTGKDRTPPRLPGALSATSDRGVAILRWRRAKDQTRIVYRVYRDGALRAETPKPTLNDGPFDEGTIVEYAVRASDRAGFLSQPLAVRFKVGFGIVDEDGAVTVDTVPPGGVPKLRGVINASALVLRWGRATDTASPIRAYRVLRDGERHADTTRLRISIPKPDIAGVWTVVAIDQAGNVGRPLLQITV